MYKTSTDRRFQKNKKEIRQAFIHLVMKKGYHNISISDIAKEADINRMTFYAHYDMIEDVFQEFIDDMKSQITAAVSTETEFDIDSFFSLLNNCMYQEYEFFQFVSKEDSCSEFRSAFRKTICDILIFDKSDNSIFNSTNTIIAGNLAASCIATAYLDWLAGIYGKIALNDVLSIVKYMLKDQIKYIRYSTISDISILQ